MENQAVIVKAKFPIVKLLVGLLLLVLILGGGFVLYKKMQSSKQPNVANINVPVGSKTYTSKNNTYSIGYPGNWFIYEYNDANSCINVSDIEDSKYIGQTTSKEHTIINLCEFTGVMPTSFPYSMASVDNSTVKPYSINSYTGIRGDEVSPLGLGEAVYLNNPKGGYVVFTKEMDGSKMFDQILDTFKFTP